MNCFNCGEVVPQGQNFCGNCGAPQSADPGALPAGPTGADAERSGSKTWIWVLLGCGGLTIISCCLGFVLLFAISGAISESAFEVLDQMATIEPELFEETFDQVATLMPEEGAVPEITATLTTGKVINCGGIGITTEAWPPTEIECEEIPAEIDSSFMNVPAYTRMNFINYPVSPSFHEPHISVFPVGAYREVNIEASDRIDQLQSLLDARPEQPSRPFPFLPVWNAGQSIGVQFEYVDFEAGSGIRYLAQYGQAAWPINNQDLFYAFQGLTADGEYYISAVLPVTHPHLPSDGDSYINDDFEAFIDSYQDYLGDVTGELEQSASKAFDPSLSTLDAMMQTLSVR